MKSKSLKSHSQKANKILSEWVNIQHPVPGGMYCLDWKDFNKSGYPYSYAVIRYASKNEEKMNAVIKRLTNDAFLDYLRELDYIGDTFGLNLIPSPASIFAGEMVFYIETYLSTFHKVLKDEQLLLIDGRVFSFLAHRSSLPSSFY